MAKQFWKAGNMLYPVPVVMVSCKDKNGKENIITVAWAGTICTSPAMVSISVRPERYSYSILKETREFVINLTTKELVYAADFCGVKSGRDVDKFKELGLHPSDSKSVRAPGILESPVNIECKLKEIKELGSHSMFIAEVTAILIDEKYLDEKEKFHLNQSELVAYSHGEYRVLGEVIGTFGYSVKKKIRSEKSEPLIKKIKIEETKKVEKAEKIQKIEKNKIRKSKNKKSKRKK